MATIKVNKEKALKAGVGQYITTSGWYKGILTKALLKKRESGVHFFEFSFESEDGLKSDYITLNLTNKDGSENFESNIFHSLIATLGLEEVPVIKAKNKNDFDSMPALCNKSVGVGLQKEEYSNADGETKYKFKALHFCDSTTNKTFSETEQLKEAKFWGREIKDKVLEAKSEKKPEKDSSSNDDEDLPF
jgi:hypothetical protein